MLLFSNSAISQLLPANVLGNCPKTKVLLPVITLALASKWLLGSCPRAWAVALVDTWDYLGNCPYIMHDTSGYWWFEFTSRGQQNVRVLELLKGFLPPTKLALQMYDLFIWHAAYCLCHRSTTRRTRTGRARHRRTPRLQRMRSRSSVYSLLGVCSTSISRRSTWGRKSITAWAAQRLRPAYEFNMYSVNPVGLMTTYHSHAGKWYTRESAMARVTECSCHCLVFPIFQVGIMSFAAKLVRSVRNVFAVRRPTDVWSADCLA